MNRLPSRIQEIAKRASELGFEAITLNHDSYELETIILPNAVIQANKLVWLNSKKEKELVKDMSLKRIDNIIKNLSREDRKDQSVYFYIHIADWLRIFKLVYEVKQAKIERDLVLIEFAKVSMYKLKLEEFQEQGCWCSEVNSAVQEERMIIEHKYRVIKLKIESTY